nr:hypothetical protein [uncultured Desulfuromonas sp.]
MIGYQLRMEFTEKEKVYLSDVSNLLYDFVLLHDFSVLISEPEYKNYSFTQYFFYRKGRPLKEEHKAIGHTIVKNSPLLLEVIIPSLGAAWVLLQIFEKVANFSLNREKLRLEVKKLRREHYEHISHSREEIVKELKVLLAEKHAENHLRQLINRLSENPIELRDLEIEEVEFDDPPQFEDDDYDNSPR